MDIRGRLVELRGKAYNLSVSHDPTKPRSEAWSWAVHDDAGALVCGPELFETAIARPVKDGVMLTGPTEDERFEDGLRRAHEAWVRKVL